MATRLWTHEDELVKLTGAAVYRAWAATYRGGIPPRDEATVRRWLRKGLLHRYIPDVECERIPRRYGEREEALYEKRAQVRSYVVSDPLLMSERLMELLTLAMLDDSHARTDLWASRDLVVDACEAVLADVRNLKRSQADHALRSRLDRPRR